ncbi:MAG: RsmB/NOP family class I SAM-dependent RNA methyltransferase [Chlamydiales bacterium]|nr:RsmB/NOP family class I SAM-dependent RNA methyltransferase [Chlamydiales bacterium]
MAIHSQKSSFQAFREHHLIQLLNGFEGTHYPLDLYISFYFKDNRALGSKDRAEISDLAYSLVRWKGLLDHLSKNSSSWEERYYTYKKYSPFDSTELHSLDLYIQASFPKELFQLIEESYGKNTLSLCKICNTRAPTTVRINPLKTTRDKLLQSWQETHNLSPCKVSSLGITFHEKVHFFSMPEFKNGLFEMQDEGSQLIAEMIQAKPGDLVLDYCAGSGGKTLGFAHKLQGKGQIYLHDVRPKALQEAKQRLKRAGIQNGQIIRSDDTYLKKLKKKMDWVLVDAPCSGTGTLRRNPDMKWRFSKNNFNLLLGEQRLIFEKALSFVKPHGFIVYATCSLLKQENELQTEHFLKTYPIVQVGTVFKSLPTLNGMDGFYAVLFQKKESLLLNSQPGLCTKD